MHSVLQVAISVEGEEQHEEPARLGEERRVEGQVDSQALQLHRQLEDLQSQLSLQLKVTLKHTICLFYLIFLQQAISDSS